MAYTYKDLKSKYDGFRMPEMQVEVDGNKITEAKKIKVFVSDVVIDLSAGFEASQATFCLYNVFDQTTTSYNFDAIKKYVLLGSVVKLSLGYNKAGLTVFAGVITKVSFFYEEGDIPGIQVTAMDVKAVMMANNSVKQLTANTYSEAVKEIFNQSVYMNLKGDGAITELTIGATPDAGATAALGGVTGGVGGGAAAGAAGNAANATDKSIEMVGESDYEFVVKVAKKYNMDFFISAGQVVFRPAKTDTSVLIEISNEFSIQNMTVDYDITSQVGSVEVRGLDPGKAKVLSGKAKNSNKLSQGNKAKSIVSGNTYVYVDPTVSTTEEAQYRAKYIQEDRTYRYGTLELTMIGLPEVMPGRFIKLTGFGKAVENTFYVYAVRHTLDSEGHFRTKIIGRASGQASSLPGGANLPSVPSIPGL